MSPHKLAAHSADMPLTPTTVTPWPQERGAARRASRHQLLIWQREMLEAPWHPSSSLKVQCWGDFPEMKWEPEALASNLPTGGRGCRTGSFHHTVKGELSECACPTAKHGLEPAWASLFFLQPWPGPRLQSSSPGEGGPLPNKLAEKSRAANGSFNHKSWFHMGQERTGRR